MRNEDTTRVNREITASQVRLIGADGEQIGIVSIDEALRRAEAATLDLVEVAGDVVPPVCKIYDYKKVLYEKKKRLKESKKKAKQMEVKEVKMRVAIDKHDRDTKLNHAREFLTEGDKVKFTIIYRGREITHPELGDKVIAAVREGLADIGEFDGPPSRMGKQIIIMMSRRKDWVPTKK
ncbi:translation initiation factor IF-3 [bacterium]|nr:translation initiation factor IF-3 [bacterium]